MSDTNDGVEGRVSPQSHPVQELSHLLPALWRGLVSATPTSKGLPVIESQVTLLRKLVASGPMSPARVAEELHLARSTISNLVRDLAADGLIERQASPVDGRSVVLTPTDHGRNILETFRMGRAEVLSEALNSLPQEDLEGVLSALPALGQLLRALDRAGEQFDFRDVDDASSATA